MKKTLSSRLQEVLEALPIKPESRIIEIGCGPGALAREISQRLAHGGHILAIDRSAAAIQKARESSGEEIKSGKLSFRQSSAEDFELKPKEKLYDFAIAIRVGAFNGRHPEAGIKARQKIAKALKPGGVLYIDGGNPLKVVKLGKATST